MTNINTHNKNFDVIRDNLLVFMYTNNGELFKKKFSDLIRLLKSNPTLSENDQKSLYQINAIAKKFNLNAHLELNKFLQKQARAETKNPVIIDYNTWKLNLGLNEQTLKLLFSTTVNFQLSTGCSNFCKRCNEWALPGIRKHFSHDAVVKIAENLALENNSEFALYSATDPLDWEDHTKNITHLIDNLSSNNLMPTFGLLTKIPRGKERIFKQLLEKKTDISASVTSLNRERIKKIEDQLSIKIHKQHDTDDLLIPAGRDEDFASIKSSITDSYGTEITPEGAFIVLPTFTSALNPTGQKRIPINKDTRFFIQKMVGSKGLKFDYFKYLKVIDLQNKKYTLKYLLDSQIENLLLDNGNYDVTQPGMISLKEYFETFKPLSVNKRKTMLSSVKKRLKEKYLNNEYTTRLKDYEDLCDQDSVTELKKTAVINFLSAIKKYLQKHNSKRAIIYYLRRQEIDAANKDQLIPDNQDNIKTILSQPDSDTFKLFNQLVFLLLNNPDNQLVSDFLNY